MTRGLLTGFACALALAGVASAATYTYTGQPYSFFGGVYTAGMRITGSFVTGAPLPPNMPMTAIGPGGSALVQSWAFNDGVNTYNQTNSVVLYQTASYFRVATDAGGNISTFDIGFMSPLPPNSLGQPMNGIRVLPAFEQSAANSPCAALSGSVCSAIPGGADMAGTSGGGTFSFASPIPTLSEWALLLLSLLLAGFGVRCLRRERGSQEA
jgi:hypothetical protein